MDKAKAAVESFIGRGGQHDTTVDEVVNPAVTRETIQPTRHEETIQAVDKEVHQDHYHTTVQPLQHREVLPEQHTHQALPVQEREIHHGDRDQALRSAQAETAKFQDSSVTNPTALTQSQAPAVAGEHVHHHVHEHVQPVIHKETIQPSVVHTTQPIHEKHTAPAEHHGMSVLPTRSLGDFETGGASLTEATRRHEEYEGDPRKYNPTLQAERTDVDKNFRKHDGLHGQAAEVGAAPEGVTPGTGHAHGSHETGNTASSGLTSSHDATSGLTGASATRTAGVGAGAAGVGVAASGLGHHDADSYRLNDPRSVTGADSGATSTGTALGGRTDGNTTSRATEAVGSRDHTSLDRTGGAPAHDITTRDVGATSEIDSQPTPTSGTTGHHQRREPSDVTDDKPLDTSVQHASQGRDPSMVDEKSSGKLTGSGADGSHSAVFGLTPDGHKYDDTQHHTTALKPAHSKDVSNTDTGSRGAYSGGVAEQMHDPRVAEKGHDGSAVSGTGSAKPGAGAPGGEQGFGQVRPEEHGSGAKMADKVDPTTDADGDGKKGIMD